MKRVPLSSIIALLLFVVSAHAAPGATDFAGAVPQPVGKITESTSQLTIRFPDTVLKGSAKNEPFKVTCLPAMNGFSSWADNNALWTYNFKAASDSSAPSLVGGSKCDVTQLEDLTDVTGKVWKAGSIHYQVIVDGPQITEVFPAQGFKGALRESDPVLLLIFDGPVDREKFFADQSGYLSYLSANAPSEKMPLAPVPVEQAKEIFSHFKRTQYVELQYTDRNWILATAKQSLIPGAQVNLTIQAQTSADNADVHADKKFTKEFSVRSQLEAEIHCANPAAATGSCLPRSPISVAFNGQLKWTDVKDSYIEYVPYKSTDGKVVRSYPELGDDQERGYWNMFFNAAGHYFPFLAQFSDTLVDSLTFNVNIEAQTQAKIELPSGLKDIDGRLLSNVGTEFFVHIGSMSEMIHVPQQLSFFEKNVPNLYLPVGVVNLNQKLTIRKTGTDAAQWAPIRDVASMIRIIRAYEGRGEFRTTPDYVSPLDQLAIPSTSVDQQLTGTKNRPTFLQFPFGKAAGGDLGGFYAIEVSSPSFEASRSDVKDNEYYNPKYVLAQVTDLAVHLKKGKTHTVAWVTSLSEAQPVAGAAVQIYNCMGQPMLSLTTDASGLVTFENREWATDCQQPVRSYSQFFDKDQFYVVAKSGDDQALTHSSWSSSSAYAMSAPGIEYFYSDINENTPHFHSVIGVNLVKPGQKVPVELIAKLPNSKGFADVPAAQLPATARIASADDENTYYNFPLTWKNGTAEIEWNVPSDASVKLGRYSIELIGADGSTSATVQSGDIEVAEFKVPLMSGIIAFPNQELVQPNVIPVSSVIRYANGVGAKNLAVDLSYYFEPASMANKDLPDFAFGSGAVKLTDERTSPSVDILPNSSRPATIQGLRTGADGSLVRDIAAEKAADGRTIAEVLKTLDRPQKLVVRVRYQDQMGEFQTLSQAKNVYNSAKYVGTSLKSGARAEAKLQAALIDVNGKNLTSLAALDFKVIRVDTKVIGEELFGGLIKNTLERELKPVHWVPTCTMVSKTASCQVGDLKAGSYAFQVTDKASQQMANTLFKVDADGRVYGAGDYYQFGDGEGSKQLPLALNKKAYKSGDKAVVSFPSPFKNCRTLVSIERSDVIEASVVNNACDKGFVEVPINASEAPNVFVSVYAITGRAQTAHPKIGESDLGRPTYRLGFANMKVDWNHFKSTVVVKTDKPKYQPGETVNVQVSVKADEGALKNGTVTLVAIEEKILELKKNDTYNVLDALMQLRGHTVDTITPLEKVETVTADNTDLPSTDSRKGGDEGGDGSTKSDFKRKLFNALVAFQPGVPVQNGVAQFAFKANDSLTRFKIFAIANDPGQKFGTGEATYLTEKDTQSYSNIPTVAHVGDNYPVKVTVQNNGPKTAKYRAEVVTVVKDANGKVISQKTLTKDVSINKATSSAIDVGQMTIDENAASIEYVIRVYDENGKVVDAMTPAPQVILPSVPLAVHDSYIVQVTNGSMSQMVTKELEALAGKGEIRVSVSNSLVTGALKQITQRMSVSMFADFFIESRLDKALLINSQKQPGDVPQILQSLLGYVDSKGFVKFYPQAQRGDVWLTASILHSLEQEPWAMKLAPAALVDKMKEAVSLVLTKKADPSYVGKTPMDWMRAQTVMGRAAFAFGDSALEAKAKAVGATFASQLQADPAAFGVTQEQWSSSDLVDYWLLQVYTAPTTAMTSPAYLQLLTPSRLVYIGNMATLAGSPRFTRYYSDETIETAKLLLGHARLHASADVARALAVGLVNANTKSWYAFGTLMSVAQGLKNFGRTYEAQAVSGSAVVAVPEEQKSMTVDWSKSASATLTSPWTDAKATVQVTHSGEGQPWVGVQTLTAVPLQAARGQGLSIDKQTHNISRDSGNQTGDVIEVTLNIHTVGTVNHVALQDPIPAGSNILSDAYGDYSNGEKSYSGYKLYFESLSAGETTVKYQYQLNNPGTFKLPPTRAEGLYMPGVYGEAPNATLNVN